ncbi:MAG: hypothetical protein FWE44_02170 [Defluviitaleaceae bacterium]|nr:hypothetical protein [Defluviitaleaceae bacterium]
MAKTLSKSKTLNIRKSVIVAGLAAVFAVSAVIAQPVFANNAAVSEQTTDYAQNLVDGISSQLVPQRVGAMGVTITGRLPRIAMQQGFEEQIRILNTRFLTQFDDFLDAHRTRASRLEYSFEVSVSGEAFDEIGQFVSVIITMRAVGANTTEAAATTVINAQTFEAVSLSDIHPNALQLISNRLVESAQAQPRLHNSNFNGINSNHPFYLENDSIVIPFASGAFTIAHRNVRTVTFPMAAFQHELIPLNHIMTLPPEQYNVVLVNLARGLRDFGYTTTLPSPATQTVNILQNGMLISSVTLGENSYFYRDAEAARSLELAPRLHPEIANRVMVPMSFFRDIMGMATTVTPQGVLISVFNQALIPTDGQNQNEIGLTDGQTTLSE